MCMTIGPSFYLKINLSLVNFMGNGLLQFGSTEFNLVHNWSGLNAEIGLVISSPFFFYISFLKPISII